MIRMPHWPMPTDKIGIDVTQHPLDRTREFLEKLGNPHKKLPPTIHVAGTNGKGSTIAFMRAILEVAGLKVHTYTSPHLINFNEQIVLAGREISDRELFDLMEECRIKAGDKKLSFFEITTCAAFLAFSRVEADILLLETGLGGRLDPTNVIEKPLLTVITPISYDHTEILGKSLTEIAQEKAGIMKKGANCVVSMQQDEANLVIDEKAYELGINWYGFEYDYSVEITESGMRFLSQWGDIDLPKPSLYGIHQYVNAGTAIAAIKTAIPNIDDKAVAKGIANAKWKARMEKIKKPYIPDDWQVWMDGGHNQSAAVMLAETMKGWSGKKYLILGMTEEKNVSGFLEPFKGIADFVCTVTVRSEPMAYSARALAKIAEEQGFKVLPCQDIEDAFNHLQEMENTDEANVLICGSLFLLGDLNSS